MSPSSVSSPASLSSFLTAAEAFLFFLDSPSCKQSGVRVSHSSSIIIITFLAFLSFTGRFGFILNQNGYNYTTDRIFKYRQCHSQLMKTRPLNQSLWQLLTTICDYFYTLSLSLLFSLTVTARGSVSSSVFSLIRLLIIIEK